MLKRVKDKIKYCFSSLEQTIKTSIFLLLPFMTFFMIMSDRTPYNYFAFVLYGVEAVLILFFVFKYHYVVIDLFALLLLLFLISIFFSQLLNLSVKNLPRTIILLSFFAFVLYQFLITLSINEKIVVYKLLVIGGLMFALFFFAYYFNDLIRFDFSDRLGRDFSDQNDLAKNLAVFGILSEILAFKVDVKRKPIYIFASFVFLFLILVTGSISNLLIFAIIALITVLYLSKGKKRIIALISIVIIICAFFAILQLPVMSYFKTRIDNMLNSLFSNSGSVDNSFVDRFNLAFYGMRLFFSKPVFGYGYDQVQYYTWGKNAFSHNNFVELLASFGIVGFAAFEIILLFPLIKNFRKTNKELSFFSLVYLFAFQMFLIIFRKKIEYFIIPLAFSFIDYKVYKCFCLKIINFKKIVFVRINRYNESNLESNSYLIEI